MEYREPISWKAPEYAFTEKSVDWFWVLGIGTAAISIASLLFKNIIFALFVIIGALAIGIFAIRKPQIIDFEVRATGVSFGATLYPYRTLDSFWVEEASDRVKIILASQHFFMPYIVIPVEEVDPESIREFLRDYLPEVEHHESVIHIIAERLGF